MTNALALILPGADFLCMAISPQTRFPRSFRKIYALPSAGQTDRATNGESADAGVA
jgi:hypothetical protein